MKKLLLVLTITLTLLLGACNNAPDDNDLENRLLALETELNATQEELNEVQSYLDRMVGQFYILPEDNQLDLANNLYVSANGYEFLVKETDYIDKTKFPVYIFDEFDNYISVDDLCNRLSLKYIGVSSSCDIGFQLRMKLTKPTEMTNEEFIVRVSMMIIELSEYDFYTLDSPQLQIEFFAGGSSYMNVRMSLLVTDKYNLHPALFWSELMDTYIHNFNYDETELQTIYDDFVLNDTFTGYVLPNFTK